MNYGKSGRNRVFDPLDVRLRKVHFALRQKMAYEPAIHHPVSPSPPRDMPPARRLGLAIGGPWQSTLPLCLR